MKSRRAIPFGPVAPAPGGSDHPEGPPVPPWLRLLTQAEAAAMLGISAATLYRLRRAGRLAFIPGRPVTIREDAVRALLAERERDGGWRMSDPFGPDDPARARAAFLRGRRLAQRLQMRERGPG